MKGNSNLLMGYKKEYFKTKNKTLSRIHFTNDDMWWSDGDPLGYSYQKETNTNFLDLALPYLKNNRVAIQAGGNCGWVTREVANHFKDVYVFEPDPSSFVCICLNLPEGNVHKFQACLGDRHGLVEMSKDHGKGGSGADYVNPASEKFRLFQENSSAKVPIMLIDDLKLDFCDFIQLDLEGYEYFALLGAEETIKKHKPLIWMERCWHKRFNVLDETIDNFFKNLGYVLAERQGKHDFIYKHLDSEEEC